MTYWVRVQLPNRVSLDGPYPDLSVAKIQAGSLQRAYEADAEIIDEDGKVVHTTENFVWVDDE